MQRTNTAQREIAVEWRAGDAEAVRPPGELLAHHAIRRHHRAAYDVAVTIQVFRRGVDDDVRAERDRLLQRGREEGVVDDDDRADAVRGRRRGPHVGDAQQGIAWRFDPDHARPKL